MLTGLDKAFDCIDHNFLIVEFETNYLFHEA